MIHPPPVRPEEPIAVTPHDGICGGESQQWLSYPTNPHVRFDERGRETGCCRMAQATAPVLDSTGEGPQAPSHAQLGHRVLLSSWSDVDIREIQAHVALHL